MCCFCIYLYNYYSILFVGYMLYLGNCLDSCVDNIFYSINYYIGYIF